jgi:predicted RNase H-like HicB family nuclease
MLANDSYNKVMLNFLLGCRDFFYYDLLGRPLPEIPNDIDLDQEFFVGKSGGGFFVESKKYPGLIATGDTYEELREALFDSILTYFDVPRVTAKRTVDNLVLNLSNGRSVKPKKPLLHYFRVKLASA